jgi:hypothetical protein
LQQQVHGYYHGVSDPSFLAWLCPKHNGLKYDPIWFDRKLSNVEALAITLRQILFDRRQDPVRGRLICAIGFISAQCVSHALASDMNAVAACILFCSQLIASEFDLDFNGLKDELDTMSALQVAYYADEKRDFSNMILAIICVCLIVHIARSK